MYPRANSTNQLISIKSKCKVKEFALIPTPVRCAELKGAPNQILFWFPPEGGLFEVKTIVIHIVARTLFFRLDKPGHLSAAPVK